MAGSLSAIAGVAAQQSVNEDTNKTLMKYLLFILIAFVACTANAQHTGQIRDTLEKKIFVNGLAVESFRLLPADTSKCKHIYVAVKQPEVKMPPTPNMILGIYHAPPSGKHEGEDIVCVKCFHLRKQIIDYGEPQRMPWEQRFADTLKAVYPVPIDGKNQ